MSEIMDAWAGLLLKEDGPQEKKEFSPSEFMQEYDTLKKRYRETHETNDFKAVNSLYEKYGIDRADQLKYSRINSMLSNQDDVDGMVVGSVPAKEVDELLQKGDFAGALSRVRSGLDEDSLRRLVDYPEDQRDFYGYSLIQLIPQLAKSDSHKSSDSLLSSFGMYKDGDQYLIRVDKDNFQQLMKSSSIINHYYKDLKDIERHFFDDGPELDLSSEDKKATLAPEKRVPDAQNLTAINYDILAGEAESVGMSRQLKI